MKRTLFFSVLFVLVCSVFAEQPKPKDMMSEIRAKRTEFIKKRIDLTAEEEKAFWPIYNEYEQKKWDLFQQRERIRKRSTDGEVIDFSKINDMLINSDLAKAQLAKVYHEKFKKILPPEKLFKYYTAEREFKEKVLNEIKRKAREQKNR
jgi:hypothetical protein